MLSSAYLLWKGHHDTLPDLGVQLVGHQPPCMLPVLRRKVVYIMNIIYVPSFGYGLPAKLNDSMIIKSILGPGGENMSNLLSKSGEYCDLQDIGCRKEH